MNEMQKFIINEGSRVVEISERFGVEFDKERGVVDVVPDDAPDLIQSYWENKSVEKGRKILEEFGVGGSV